MLGDLSTYALRDFFPYTPEVYFRLFVRHNEAVWPMHVVALAVGLLALWLAWRGRGRPVAGVVAACWAFVGYTFHIELYANLNWAARWFGWAFIAQAVVVLVVGLLGRLDAEPSDPLGVPEWVGLAVGVVAIALFPLLAPLAGRPWTGVEVFGVAPDPTVIATLGLVLLGGRTRWALWVIPLVWAAISGATAIAMDAPIGLVTPALALAAVGAGVWKSLRTRG